MALLNYLLRGSLSMALAMSTVGLVATGPIRPQVNAHGDLQPLLTAIRSHRVGTSWALQDTSGSRAAGRAAGVRGAWELFVALRGMDFFSRRIPGLTFETSYRWPGNTGRPDGHFSIGMQAAYWPSVGRWNQLHYDIGSISSFRLDDRSGNSGSIYFGNVEVRPNELFLMPQHGVSWTAYGRFIPNPINGNILELDTYRITNLRTAMVGLNVPVRWYFGEHHMGKPRFYVEGGFGFDVIIVNADYYVTTRGYHYDGATDHISYDVVPSRATGPLKGTVSNNILFSNGNVGAGIRFGRFMLFTQARFLFTSTYTRGDRDYKRIRGNILAMPALTGADSDLEIAKLIERDGIVPFGRTSMTGSKDPGSETEVSGDINGVRRIWDPKQWVVGLSFQLR